MQKDLSIDTLPVAVAYDPKHEKEFHGGFRRRSASVQSRDTTDTVESEVDIEILLNDLEVSDSPPLLLRKKLLAP